MMRDDSDPPPAKKREQAEEYVLADGHPLFRAGLAQLLKESSRGPVTVHEAASLDEILAICETSAGLDLILVDPELPGIDGASGLDRLRERAPGVPIVAVAAAETLSSVMQALERGARGYIPKSEQPAVVMAALQLVWAGGVYVPAGVLRERSGGVEPPFAGAAEPEAARYRAQPELTPRQSEVLAAVAAGMTNKEIARALHMTEGTVKIHVSAILRALGARSRRDAAARARRLGLIRPSDRHMSGGGSAAAPNGDPVASQQKMP